MSDFFRRFQSQQAPGINLHNKVSFIFLLIFFLSSLNGIAQSDRRLQKLFDEAKQFLGQQDYEQAIERGMRILARDSTFLGAHLLLADIYHDNNNTTLEIFHLQKARQFSKMPLILLRLGNAYLSVGEYEKGLDAFQIYSETGQIPTGTKSEVNRKIESCRFALNAIKNPVEFKPERLPDAVNSEFDEYWPSLSIDQRQLIFTRLIKAPGRQPQEDFYISENLNEGWKEAQAMAEINTPENEGAHALSADGKILFFTACNRRDSEGSCDIYYSVSRGDKWSIPVNAGTSINSPYWEAQPSISSDGRYLYFSSNRPGGKGMRDIWRAENLGFDQNGKFKWGKPMNLGDSINTPGNETSPFIHAGNQDFYFASDYHIGMGGFDLFVSTLSDDSIFSGPQNLGFPINTHNDEQGLHISADGLTAYFSSGRDSISGLDIYSFAVDESIRPHPATYARASVFDSETGNSVQAQIELVDLVNPGEKRVESTNIQGKLLLSLPTGKNYSFSVSKEGYLFYSNTFNLEDIRKIHNPYELDIRLKPVKAGAEMNLYNIYFETDSFRILPESGAELQKLVEFLRTNPNLTVEVQGHTDNTGSSERNKILSEKRAHSVVGYLVQNGIQKERLQWAGYGEKHPVADNETLDGRRQNRRTTIKILGD